MDPDVDLGDPQQRDELRAGRLGVLGVIAAGGILGALARAALTPVGQGSPGFSTATVLINMFGSGLIGVLITWLRQHPRSSPLVRPFLGVGVLGGFTTFSAYAVDVHRSLVADRPVTGLVIFVLTPTASLAAVWCGATLAAGSMTRRGWR